MSQKQQSLVLKPFYIPWFIALKILPSAFRGAIMGGLFFGALLYIVMNLAGFSPPAFWWPFIFSGLLCFFIVLLIIFMGRIKTLQETEYRCDEKGIEYMEGFWTVEKKRITYRVITEVQIRRTMLQRLYGIGTIYLAVPSLNPRGPLSERGIGGLLKRLFATSYFTFGGVALEDIKDPDAVYQWIEERLSGV
ncbi:MAG: PH domain-containing protein [Gammaproteobacteria bacterium]